MKQEKPRQLSLIFGDRLAATSTEQDCATSPPAPLPLDSERWRKCQQRPLHVSMHDQEAMRAWLLEWGKRNRYPGFSFPFNTRVYTDPLFADRRFGRMRAGEANYKRDLQPPYNQDEHFTGEWLVRCVEHCKRFDSGEQSIPPQEQDLKRQWANEEE